MLLAFPYMHSYLFPEDLVPGIRFFDPGMQGEPDESAYRPEGLPLDSKTATALIQTTPSGSASSSRTPARWPISAP